MLPYVALESLHVDKRDGSLAVLLLLLLLLLLFPQSSNHVPAEVPPALRAVDGGGGGRSYGNGLRRRARGTGAKVVVVVVEVGLPAVVAVPAPVVQRERLAGGTVGNRAVGNILDSADVSKRE